MRPTTIEPGQFQPGKQLRTLRNLLPYLWPRERADLRLRVVLAIVFLVAAKAANVCVPILLRDAVDGLGAPVEGIVVVPLALLLAYGVARVLARGFGELRDALFAKVAQHAIRRVA
ncbi:MAG: metal ABC transporter permease, partial [Proteobacteria bacterium]|nr:metal ABC transporter permease [Pseudomonadota bacterium]